MTQKNGRKETHKCLDISILASIAENSSPRMTTYALSVAELIRLDLSDAPNAETP
jgi:hypothetical protein